MLVADTSTLFAFFDAADAHHQAARSAAARLRPFSIPTEILAETLALLRLRMGPDESRTALAVLVGMPHARIAATRQSVIDDAVQKVLRGGPLSYEDWIVALTCKATGAQAWTFDGKLRRESR